VTAFRKPLEEIPSNRKNGRNYSKPKNTQSIPVGSTEEKRQPKQEKTSYTMLHKVKTGKVIKLVQKDKDSYSTQNTPY